MTREEASQHQIQLMEHQRQLCTVTLLLLMARSITHHLLIKAEE